MAEGASFHLYRFHNIVVLTMEYVVTLNIVRFKSVLCILLWGMIPGYMYMYIRLMVMSL